jgi:MFS family permease
MGQRRIIRTYLAVGATTTLAQSLIWGVNTLFLLDVGLDIFEVMVVNAAFTVSQMFFEVPTGIVADTLGRRISYLLSCTIILAATVLYLGLGLAEAGPVPFALVSVLLGFGFTFYTGAVDAWMVDALHAVGYEGRLEPIFARYGMVFGVSMLVGTTAGGLLGQLDLWVPYAVRAVILVPAILIGLVWMRELGFTPRPLKVSRFGEETRRIASAGVAHGLGDRVVRFIMFASLVQGLFFFYGFYSWQRYFLDLLGRDLIWVAGVIAALVGLTQILGNALVGPVTRRVPDRGVVLMWVFGLTTVSVIGAALSGSFWIAVPLYLLATTAFGVYMPVKQGWINARIPSEQRATIISLDALFNDGGNTLGQLGFGYASRAVSIPFAWVLAGASQAIALPFVAAARRAERAEGDAGIAAPAVAGAADAAEPPAAGAAGQPAAEQPAAAWSRPLPRPDGCAQAMPQPGSASVSHSEGV